MSLTLIILSCLSALISAQNSSSKVLVSDIFKISRIIGGSGAAKSEFPHQVSLQLGHPPYVHHICGGSIIDSKWVLTAAHCVVDLPEDQQMIIKAGKNAIDTKEKTEQTAFLDKVFIHREYRGSISPFDIALIKLDSSFKFNSYVSPIALPEANALPKGKVMASGWGSTSRSETPVLPSKLQKVTLTIVALDLCRQAMQGLKQPWEIHDTNLCTGPLTGEFSTCNGDSGGPLIEKNEKGVNKLVGIVSWGVYPCAADGAPAIFVRVSAFVDWIRKTMKDN